MTHLPLIAAIFGQESMPTCWTPNEAAVFVIEDVIEGLAAEVWELVGLLAEAEEQLGLVREALNSQAETVEHLLVENNELNIDLDAAQDRIAELKRIASI